MRVRLLLFTVIALLTVERPTLAAFPEPQGRVNDFAGVLDPQARGALEEIVRQTEQATSAELAVVTVASLDGLSVEEYAMRLFERWGIGKKSDNGVLVLICPPERKMRIEVGYGLEGVLPDGLAGSIIRDRFTPRFREGNYGQGTVEGVRRVGEVLRAKHIMTPEERRALEEQGDARPPRWLMTPFFGLFITVGGLALGAGIRMRSLFPLLFGGLFGGIPGIMALVPFFNASLLVLGPLALVALGVGYLKLGTMSWGAADTGAAPGDVRATTSRGRRRSSGTAGNDASSSSSSGGSSSSPSTPSSSSGSSWSSGSSSGSSFGGGRSGGGGASGSW